MSQFVYLHTVIGECIQELKSVSNSCFSSSQPLCIFFLPIDSVRPSVFNGLDLSINQLSIISIRASMKRSLCIACELWIEAKLESHLGFMPVNSPHSGKVVLLISVAGDPGTVRLLWLQSPEVALSLARDRDSWY